jgi:hypothetical protein
MTSADFNYNPTISSIILLSLCVPLGLLIGYWQVRRRRKSPQTRATAHTSGDLDTVPSIASTETDPLLPKAAGVR